MPIPTNFARFLPRAARSSALLAVVVVDALTAASNAAAQLAAQHVFPTRVQPIPWSGSQAIDRVEVADLDRDGRLDVLAVRALDDTSATWVLIADADGGYAVPQDVGGYTPVLDLDGDGIVDLADVRSAGLGTTRVDVRLSDGNGGFGPSVTHVLVGDVTNKPTLLTSADIDADGRADLVAAFETMQQLIVIYGDGAGGFASLNGVALTGQPMEVALVDVDADGDADAVVRTILPESIRMLRNEGGVLGAPIVVTNALLGANSLRSGDLDGDGALDIAVLKGSESAPRWFAGDGQGGFGAPLALPATGLSSGSQQSLCVRDHDHDGIDDLLLIRGDSVGWFRGSAPQPQAYAAIDVGHGSWKSIAADLDGAGSDEWVGTGGHEVVIAQMNGPESAQSAIFARELAPLDYDGDGRSDLVALGGFSARTWKGNGDGTFQSAGALTLTAPAKPFHPECADVDADGRVEVVVDVTTSGAQATLRAFAVAPSGAVATSASVPLLGVVRGKRNADLDGDGAADVVAFTTTPAFVRRLETFHGGGGAWNVGAKLELANAGNFGGGLDLADFDLDGELDACVWQFTGSTVAIAAGNGDGSFAPPQTYPVVPSGAVQWKTLLDDYDDDGRMDVVSVATSTGELCATNGLGAQGFAAPLVELSGLPLGGLCALDLDADGRREVFASAHSSNGDDRLVRMSSGAWTDVERTRRVWDAATGAAADFDLDGRVDIVSGNETAGARFVRNQLGPEPGLVSYGTGTADCRGRIVATANVAPKVGASEFKLTWTNAPANASALAGIAFSPEVAGSDVLGVGVTIHIGLFGPVFAYTLASDASGAAALAFPVPNVPELAGVQAYTQALWIEPVWQSCSSSALPWSSSSGLEVTVLP